MRFGEITGPDSLKNVKQIQKPDVKLLWHADYWNGPRAGMLSFHGEECWFEVIAENADADLVGWYRRFAVIRLTPEQHAEELRWHLLFQEKVGGHTDYDVQEHRALGSLHPREQWHEFYDVYRERTPWDLSRNEVLAWFEY